MHSYEMGRSNADHREDNTIEAQCFADNVRGSAKARLPGSIIHHRDRVRAGSTVLLRQEEASLCRPEVQCREVVAGYEFSEHALRSGARSPSDALGRSVARERSKSRIFRLIIFQIRI